MVLSDLGDPTGRVLATRNSYGGLSGMYGQPLFSPDGSRILFLRVPPLGPVSLWVIGADGSDERLVATASSGIIHPIWDPTGRLIAFQTREGLRIVSVEDGGVHEIEELGGSGTTLMAWSPDGAWLAFSETVGRREFWVNRDVLGKAAR